MKQLTNHTLALMKESWELYWELLKVMVPVMVGVRLATQFGVIEFMAGWFAPVMTFMGLPGEMGIVWVTAIMINLYAGAAALVTLLPEAPLTLAQATVLGALMLVAHSLPMEQRITQLAGTSLIFTTLLRLLGAIALGWLLFKGYGYFNALQEPVAIDWLPATESTADWTTWTLDSLQSLATIFVILLALLALLKILEIIGFTAAFTRLLTPLLRLLGISEAAAPLTISGLLLGISLGGALILKEAKSGRLSRKDIFLSVSLLCLCHSLIEDTLFVMALGAHYSGVLIARMIFSILAIALLALIVDRLPERSFNRYLCSGARI